MHRGVCPACLDEDAEEGRDHYCRRSWAFVEAVVVPGTELASRLTVLGVFTAVCFSFGRHLPESPGCFAVIATRLSPRSGFGAAIRQTCCRSPFCSARPSARAGRSLNASGRQAASFGRHVRKGCHISPRWVYRCPMVSDRWSRQSRPPLTSLPPAWRTVTITAIANLLFGVPSKAARLSPSVREAFRKFERRPVPEYHEVSSPTWAVPVMKLRTETEYRQLARGIVESGDGKVLPQKKGRARNRAIGKLMRRALSGG
ncbi:Hypothetical protein NGAL_HAMBI2605_57160 [Neorhizobium galegae bv. orientalis]|nr:Hypothetical protein NGAL_HAMBI2566_59170 [Neorhizobium galegae bv. orientalis]CDZ67435.1 Hypothetical protein NGAL_HAMBI2605_57160 [Neorhizobium galegae bv. orientalis]CDZ71849.1 Hypothetical protein NGAL_HAMBI2610_34650 [Neorhizobium galegae bv. orientalis]